MENLVLYFVFSEIKQLSPPAVEEAGYIYTGADPGFSLAVVPKIVFCLFLLTMCYGVMQMK